MTPRPLRRLGAALVNLLFLLAWVEPAMLPPCAAHEGMLVAAIAAQTAAAPASAAHAGHATHDAAVPAQSGDHEGQADHACRCLGQCCAAGSVVVPPSQVVRWQVVVRRLVEPAPSEPAAPSAEAPRLLPFSNGPPPTA